MRNDFIKRNLSLTVCALLLTGSSLFAQDDEKEETKKVNLSEVTILGEKVGKTLKDTSTAISVFTSEQIEAAQNESIYDFSSKVPNVVNNSKGIPSIRGINGAGVAIGGYAIMSGSRARVSTTVDGISEAWNGVRYIDVGSWDTEQVEILRGPQSTNQGRNSIGGAIVVKTKDPTFYTEGSVRVGYESEDNKATLAAMISTPIIEDELAIRLTAEGLYGNSYIDYIGTSTPWDPSEINQTSVRGKLLWVPKNNDNLTVKTTINHREYEGGANNEITPDTEVSDYTFNVLAPRYLVRYTDSRNDTINFDVEYSISDDLNLNFIAGYSDTNTKFEQAPSAMNMDLDEESTTLEARLLYSPKDSKLSSMAGLYFYNRDQDTTITEYLTMDGKDKINALAFYTEETLQISDKLDFIFGARIERENQKRDVVYNGNIMNARIAETMFLPKVGLNYELTPEHSLGVNARKGYNPGGGGLTWDNYTYYEFDKEEVFTYEVSTRSLFFDNNLTVNTNTFYNDYDGYQGTVGSGWAARLSNIPKGKSYGFELESSYLASDNLEINAGFGLLKTKVTESPTDADYKGNEFDQAPKFTGNIGFIKHFSKGYFLGSDLNYVGEYYTNVDNTETTKAGNYTLVNANLGYETNSYSIRAYVKNLFDRDTVENYRGTFAAVGKPRTFGITFDYKF